MYDILFYNGTILAADGPIANGYVAVKDGIIASIGKGNPSGIDAVKSVDLEGNILSPGFIDIHTHGAGGSDFMDGTADAIVTAARIHLRHGTTTICPTSVTCDDEELFTFMDCYQHAKSIRENMPHLAGIHLEGPYLSPGQAGAQQSDQMKRPLPEHYMKILEKSRGNIIRWSSAPEIPGVIEFGDILEKHGIIPSIAHTDADLFTVKRAMEHGYSILTHFYSGMSQMKRVNGYRIPGVVEAVIVVNLDERCKRQQVGEGWFATVDDVPKQAISMTVSQILKSRCIVSVVPYGVKAEAVRNTLTQEVNNMVPATILKTHPDWNLFLDKESARYLAVLP